MDAGMDLPQGGLIRSARHVALPIPSLDASDVHEPDTGECQTHPVVVVFTVSEPRIGIEETMMVDHPATHDHTEDGNIVTQVEPYRKIVELCGRRSPHSNESFGRVVEHVDRRERQVRTALCQR
jgi:hypothetical protein